MASITSMMNSNYNTSSIYGTRNVLSGLASGMDTETMIENAVSGIKLKIQNLLKKRTKVEWQQEAYRSIIDKAVNFNTKYTSYSSKTNLLSSSFFTNAVLTTAKGTYAAKVSATGKTSSDIKINAVKQLATAASYSVNGSAAFGGDFSAITGGKAVDLTGEMNVSTIKGSLSIKYGAANGTTFDLDFDELDVYDNAEDLADAIREKLSEQTWTYTKNGIQETVNGSDVVNVEVDSSGNIKFSDKTSNGNSVYISSASGSIKSVLGVNPGEDETSLRVGNASLSQQKTIRNYLSGKSLTVSLNGTSKTISMANVMRSVKDPKLVEVPKVGDVIGTDEEGNDIIADEEDVASAEAANAKAWEGYNDQLAKAFQNELDKAFGAGKVKASVSGDSRLSFEAVEEGSTLTLGGSAVKALGFENGDSNYINTSKTIKDLLGKDSELLANNRLKGTFYTYDGKPTAKTNGSGATYYVDDVGNRVDKDGFRITDTNEYIYNFKINGASIQVSGDTTLEGLMTAINSNASAGVKVSYSKLTNEFKFTATETGSNSKIEFGGLAKDIFNPSSSVKSSDSFADAYGLNVNEGNRNITFNDPTSRWGTSDFTITSDMTKDEVIEGLEKLFAEKGLEYKAEYDEESGQFVIKDKDGETVDSQVNKIVSFAVPGGGISQFAVTSDMTMEDVVKELNESPFSMFGYTASVDEQSGQIVIKDEDGNVLDLKIANESVDDGEKAQELTIPSYSSFTAGQDAIMDVEINGVQFKNLSRSSNVFDIDGLNITVKGTFDETTFKPEKGEDYEPITFETVTDSDKIIEAIRSFVNDYNEMVTELKGAYSTQPAYNSKNERYDPLSAEEEEKYTESELAAYNEKAKQGILFGDTTLSSFYSKLLGAIAPGGTDGQTLREIGISTSYENGLTTLSLDEDKLRNALDSDLDKVKNAFAKTKEGGSSSDGLMQSLQNTLNTYVKTTGEPKGVLITKAGSVKAPTSLNNNSLNSQISNLDKQIERWQDKMSSQIDRYTKQFSKMEQLVAAMNSQASALASLMGGYEGY